MSTSQEQHFKQFMQQREAAARAYVSGDAAPLAQLSTHVDDATFYGPRGGAVRGAQTVSARYAQDVHAFQAGGETHFEILHMAASADLAYWVGYQHARVRMGKSADVTPMSLRITELFRLEQGEWKLIHRHADTATKEAK